MTAAQVLRLAVELAIDLLRGHLEKRPGLPHRDAERQAKAAREAGRNGTVQGPPLGD